MEELEKETTISKNSAQIRISKALTEISRFESEDEATKQLLQKEYGSLEKIEEAKELLEIEVQRNKKESSYVQIPFILQKQSKPRKGKVVENEEEIIREILDVKIKRTNNIIEASEEGVVPESALKLREITMDDIRRKNVYYNYLKENNLKYNPNPYTNTGVFSITTLLENNMLFLIFIIFTFLSIDLFLLEVEEGSYKIIYTQPYERGKIFISKIISTILIMVLILVVILVVNFLVNTILNETGDFREPIAVSENISSLFLNKENIDFKIISTGKHILLSIILFLTVIFFNIVFISFLSVFTDSITKTMGIEILMIMLSLLFRKFVSPNSIIHGITPFSYIFTEDVLINRYNTNYIFGILLNLILSGILLFISYKRFKNKDFLGSGV